MRALIRIAAAVILMQGMSLLMPTLCLAADVKQPDMAGLFYPSDGAELRELVDGLISKAAEPPSIRGRLVALVAPHAGYGYSGHVAAHAYRALKGRGIKTVIIMASAHKADFAGASVYARGAFRTPLGDAPIDEGAAASLMDGNSGVRFNPDAYKGEHSIEVHLPFLQRSLAPGFRIVPVLMGRMDVAAYDSLAESITKLAEREGVLLIASTDLSHYHSYDKALSMDSLVTVALERISESSLKQALSSGSAELCGAYPTLMAIQVARRVGATRAALYKYANSGDVTGDKASVVGYASAGFYIDPLTAEDKAELLALARKAITEALNNARLIDDIPRSPRLMADGAAFVSINREGRLRGCIGHAYAAVPLYASVVENAVKAAIADPRFPPMSQDELPGMRIEISILSTPTPIDPKDVEVGRHGLIIMKAGATGLLLPQVPKEQGWNRQAYLEQVGIKAGLPADAWKGGARLLGFTADVFGEP